MLRLDQLAAFLDATRVADRHGMVPKYPGVHVLGCADARVSFHAQQIRAINLIAALESHHEDPPSKTLCVIGGGIAGTTAAVYALERGFKVVLIERDSRVLSLQSGSGRWVHPNIYDWPRPGWSGDSTWLPVMNWTAGTAREVVATLRQQWDNAVARHKPEVRLRSEVNRLERSGGWQVGWGSESVTADVVILAVGFGEEPEFPNIGSYGYWADTDIHQRLRRGGMALVSGTGDGGLIDVMRLCLHDFQQQQLLEIAHGLDVPSLTSALMKIERNHDQYGSCESLTAAYGSLAMPSGIVDQIARQSRDDVKVVLNSRSAAPFDRSSAVLHRVIVSLLIRLGCVEYKSGDIDPSAIVRQSNRYRVSSDGEAAEFDLVVVRHGPPPALRTSFPEIFCLVEPSFIHNRQHRTASDTSRQPLWDIDEADAGETGSGERTSVRITEESLGAEIAGTESGAARGRQNMAAILRVTESRIRDYCVDISRATVTGRRDDGEARITAILEEGGKFGLPMKVELVVLIRHSANGLDVYCGIPGPDGSPPVLAQGWETIDHDAVNKSLGEAILAASQKGSAS